MTRINVLNRIDTILREKCKECPTKEELVKKYRNRHSLQDGHCNSQCRVGTELQMLGKLL